MADEQAALRRVATLVARGVPAEELFAAVIEEVGRLLDADMANLCRYDSDGMTTFVATWGSGDKRFPVGSRWPLGGENLGTLVFETGRAVRIGNYADASGALSATARDGGLRSAVATPIVVEGRTWGMIGVGSSHEEPMPPDTEARLGSFTELVAMAIADAESRSGLARLADEQAALRRVATLVARGVPAEELFAAVTHEMGRLLSVEYAHLGRYEADGSMTVVAVGGSNEVPVGSRWDLGGKNVSTLVHETGRPARMDGYANASGPLGVGARDAGIGSGVAAPIIVEGRLWGVMAVYSTADQPLHGDTEARLANFTELLATAVANAESRDILARLAEEQAALRRVATLVAGGAPPEELFAAVVEEVGRVLGTELAGVGRYESDGAVTVLATWAADGGHGGAHPLVPGPWPLEGGDVASTIWRTGRPVVITDYRGVPGRIAAFVRDELGVGSSVGSPIVVEGRLWGALFAHARQVDQPLAREAEARLTAFTELVATAIANAESRAELGASRARIVAAADETRRRIERDLHDGIQQRLVSLGLELRLAESTESADADEARSTIGRVAGELGGVTEELREIARGIHPAILSEGGLGPALRTLARRSAIPVELGGVVGERLPEPIEVAAYYVVSEAVANATKHASATRIDIEATAEENTLKLAISDDGVGGADPRRGSGLVGLRDRVEALGGTIDVASPVEAGTSIVVALPLERPLPASR